MLLVIFHTVSCALPISSNLFLLYLILNHTPKHLRSYSSMLFTLCVYELISSCSSFIIFPRIVPLGFEGIACIYTGPCVYMDSDYACFLIYTFQLHGYTMYNLQMTANFCFRFYVIKRSNPGVVKVVMANLLLLSPTICCAYCFITTMAPEPIVREVIHRHTPQYDFSENRLIGIVDLSHSWALPSIFLIVSTALPCMMTNLMVGRAVSRFLHEHTVKFSTRSRATHHDFLKVLTFQATISQTFNIAVACYVVGQLGIAHSPFQEYGTHMIGDLCIVSSPLITMYYVRPYRRQVLRMLGRQTSKVSTMSMGTAGSIAVERAKTESRQ